MNIVQESVVELTLATDVLSAFTPAGERDEPQQGNDPVTLKRFVPAARYRAAQALDLSSFKPAAARIARLLLVELADRANLTTLTSNRSILGLAKAAGIGKTSAIKYIQLLEDAGLLVCKHIRRRKNVYMIIITDIEDEYGKDSIQTFRKIVGSGRNLDSIHDALREAMTTMKAGSLSPPMRTLRREPETGSLSPPQHSLSPPRGGHKQGNNRVIKNKRKVQKKSLPQELDLPDWIDPEMWADFVEHRKALKVPVTKVVAKRLFQKLDRIRTEEHDANGIIETSICNGWKGVFAPKGESNGNHQYKTTADRIAENERNLLAELNGEEAGDVCDSPVEREIFGETLTPDDDAQDVSGVDRRVGLRIVPTD